MSSTSHSTVTHPTVAGAEAADQQHEAGISGMFARRVAGQPAWAVVTEVFIGLGWMRAFASKVIEPSWWSGEYLASFLVEHSDQTLDWYAPFIDAFIAPNAMVVALLVLVLQLVVGASLLSGRVRALGLGLGMAMNLHFVAAGAVNPSAFYLLAQGALTLWLIDRWSADERRTTLPTVAATGLAMAGFNVPFIATLHPAEVIDDPAIMMITVGSLACLASVVALAGHDREAVEVSVSF